MRYADGGGLTARERAARERVRGQAADMFEQDLAATEIAARLRGDTQVRPHVAASLDRRGPGGVGLPRRG